MVRRPLAVAALLVGIAGASLVSSDAHAVGVDDLAVTQTAPVSASAGGTATFQVRITNNGPDATTGEVIVPGGVTGGALKAVTPVGGVCAKGRNSVYTCNFGVMAPGATATALVSVQVDNTATSVSSRAALSGGDTNAANNVSNVTVPVVAAPGDLQVNATASTKSPDAGAQVDYRFAIKNTAKTASLTPGFDATLPANVVGANGDADLSNNSGSVTITSR